MSVKRVFLVDDDADIRRLAEVAFAALSEHQLTTFASGTQLCEQMTPDNDAGVPDLLILDVMMPAQSGPDLLSQLQQTFSDRLPPVAFLTAKVQPSEVAELETLGVREVLPKPFAPRWLIDRVSSLLAETE